MPAFCLVPDLADRFKQDIVNGKINPDKLSKMTSEERHAFFTDTLGESNATPVNALFESKLLLKHQQQGFVNWATKVLGQDTPAGRDVISRIQRMDKLLNPAEEKAFLQELASQKLGTHISYEEAQNIATLSKQVATAKQAIDRGADRMNYGHAVVKLNNYINDLKAETNKMSFAEIKKNPGKAAMKAVSETAGNAKAIKASMDNSAIFRQGWKTLWSNPKIWLKNARQSFVDLVQTFGGKKVLDAVQADIVSRPTYPLMKQAKLDVGILEEAYPTTLPEKIPVVGRLYKASEAAFTAFVQRTRADVFDKYIDIANRSGVDLSPEELQSIGKLTNSLTGRGNLGRAEPAAGVVNNVLFSPRLIKSHIDLLTQPLTGAGGSAFVRRQAALNLVKVISGTAAVLTIAKALDNKSVELDPRSSDFGKIRIKDTRFDVTGGMASLVTLASRLATMSTKSSTTDKVYPLNARDKKGNPAFGAPTGLDVVVDFFENKLSPAASVIKDLLKQSDFQGNKPTVGREANNLFTPLPITTGIELWQNPNSAPFILALLADALGIATNTYSQSKSKTNSSSSLKSRFQNQSTAGSDSFGLAGALNQAHKEGAFGAPRVPPLNVEHTAQQAMIAEKERILMDPNLTEEEKREQLSNLQFDDLPNYILNQS